MELNNVINAAIKQGRAEVMREIIFRDSSTNRSTLRQLADNDLDKAQDKLKDALHEYSSTHFTDRV